MCRRIDSSRQTTYDGETGPSESGSQFFGALQSVTGSMPRTHERHGELVGFAKIAADVEQSGRIVNLAEELWITILGQSDDFDAVLGCLIQFTHGLGFIRRHCNLCSEFGTNSINAAELVATGAKNCVNRTEPSEKILSQSRSHARHE